MKLVEPIVGWQGEIAAIRRDLHAHPELAYQENRTSDIVAQQLESWGIEVHRGLGVTGVGGVIRGASANGRSLAIGRASCRERRVSIREDVGGCGTIKNTTAKHSSTPSTE